MSKAKGKPLEVLVKAGKFSLKITLVEWAAILIFLRELAVYWPF